MVRCGCNAASATTCDAIVLCVAQNLGPGLRYDTASGLIGVQISGNVDNATVIGTDGGIFTPGTGASPDPASGRRTVAGLGEQIICATTGGGGGMAPFSSPYGMEYAVANRMDMISLHTFALADGVAHSRVSTPGDDIADRTDNPSTIIWRNISSLALQSLYVDAGSRVSPTGNESGAPTALLSPDGGWWGFYANNWVPQTLAQSLWQLSARSVAQIAVYGGDPQTTVDINLTAAIDAVLQVGAQAWTIMGVPGYVTEPDDDGWIKGTINTNVASVTGAGLVALVDLFDEDNLPPEVTPWTPAEIVASGATWVRILSPRRSSNVITTARISELVAAGLQVITATTGRHVDTTEMFALGVRCIASDSAVYSRGVRGQTGDLNYRKEIAIPGLQTRGPMEGSLTLRTDDGLGIGDIGYARQAAVGRYFQPGFGWTAGIGNHFMSQLLGELCPIPVSSGYRIRIRFRIAPEQVTTITGNIPKMGVFFASPTDLPIEWATADGSHDYQNGYWFTVSVGSSNAGDIVLGKVNNGDFSVIDSSLSFPAIDYSAWFNFNIHVIDSDTISFGAGHDGVEVGTTITDADHRGPYLFYGWEDDYTLPASTSQQFGHGYAPYELFESGSPMIEFD